jgi:hypothetical protein
MMNVVRLLISMLFALTATSLSFVVSLLIAVRLMLGPLPEDSNAGEDFAAGFYILFIALPVFALSLGLGFAAFRFVSNKLRKYPTVNA